MIANHHFQALSSLSTKYEIDHFTYMLLGMRGVTTWLKNRIWMFSSLTLINSIFFEQPGNGYHLKALLT